jgi:hypothetical protein
MTIQTTQIVKSLIQSKSVTIRHSKTIKSKVLNIRGLPNPEFKIEDNLLLFESHTYILMWPQSKYVLRIAPSK